MATKLTDHFALEEFTVSETADELHLDNTPTAEHRAHLQILAEAMETVRALFDVPIHVTSAYRSPAVNAAVGGVPGGDHPLGFACDFHVAGRSDFVVAQRIRDSDLEWDQLIWERGRCVHFSVNPRMRQQVLSQHGGPGTQVTQGIA
jgi:zinc D-Ala-D-Ala carboxypeptidase